MTTARARPTLRDAMDIVNLSEMDPAWHWLSGADLRVGPLGWQHVSTQSAAVPMRMPRRASLQRLASAHRAAGLLEAKSSLLVSHGPRMTMYGTLALTARLRPRRHLAYSFNFTVLPQGPLRRVMGHAFRQVDRFVCFSTMERGLYAAHFDLDIDRFDMIHWSARPPAPAVGHDPSLPANYVCAIGSQGRDYPLLLEAMRRLPALQLVLVATPESLGGAPVPANVQVRCNVPMADAMAILHGARFNVVPLLGSEVPCGHVTLVAAMHSHKASIVSDSRGVADYVHDEVDGLTVAPGNSQALARAIERLWDEPRLSARLGEAAGAFARAHCDESAAVGYLSRYLGASTSATSASATSGSTRS